MTRALSILAMFMVGNAGSRLVQLAGYTTEAWICFAMIAVAALMYGITMAIRTERGEFL